MASPKGRVQWVESEEPIFFRGLRRRSAVTGDGFMDAGEYEHAARVSDEAISETVARYLHDAILEREKRLEGNELT